MPDCWRVSRGTEQLAGAWVGALVVDEHGNAAIRGRGHKTSNPAMPGSAGQAGRNTRDCTAPHRNRKSLDHPRSPSVVRLARRRDLPDAPADDWHQHKP